MGVDGAIGLSVTYVSTYYIPFYVIFMKRDLTSRRHFISAGAIGLTTSIAGCSDLYNIGNEPIEDPNDRTPPQNDTAPDETEYNIPEPPAFFKAPTLDYSFYKLQVRQGENPDPANLDLHHKDSSIFTIEIQSANSATATLEQTNVARAINLRLNVRNASGTFQKTPPVTLETTDEDTFETHTVEFDLSGISLPRGAGSICELIGTDTHPNDDYESIFQTPPIRRRPPQQRRQLDEHRASQPLVLRLRRRNPT